MTPKNKGEPDPFVQTAYTKLRGLGSFRGKVIWPISGLVQFGLAAGNTLREARNNVILTEAAAT